MAHIEHLKRWLRPTLAVSAMGLISGLFAACGGGGSVSSSVLNTSSVTLPASKQASYVKVCLNGDVAGTGTCPLQPLLTARGVPVSPTDWGCTLDKSTGLMWEAINFEFRKKNGAPNNTQFTNYTSTSLLQRWAADPNDPTVAYKPFNATQAEIDSLQNASGYQNWVNRQTAQPLCGNTKWRIPSGDELQGLYVEHLLSQHGIPGTSPVKFYVDKFFPDTYNEAYITSFYTARAGTGKDGDGDLFSDAISFKGDGNSVRYLWPTGSATRQNTYPLRLVADCNCKPVGPTQVTRNWGKSVLLPDQSVLTMGEPSTNAFAERFNPATELWTSAGQFAQSDQALLPSQRHSATLVGDKVVVIGGVSISGAGKKVWIYDSRSGTWSMGADASTRHIAHGAIAIGNQKVLVIGGDCQFGVAVACASGSVEEYDVAANTWTQKSPMPIALQSSSTTQLEDGRILVAGGSNNFGSVDAAQIYDPATNTWSKTTSSMNESRYYHTATLLKSGKVLVAGGNKVLNGVATASKTAEIYDPVTDVWSLVTPMAVIRTLPTATLLADGRVMLAGGTDTGAANPADSVEIYDPRRNTWTFACKLTGPRYAHNATLLADGVRILISGGTKLNSPLFSAEIYTP